MTTVQKPELSRDPIAFQRKRLLYRLARGASGVGLALVLALLLIILIRGKVGEIRAERGRQEWRVERLERIARLYTDRDKARRLKGALERLLPSRLEVATVVVPQLRTTAETRGVRVDFRIGTDRPASGDLPRGVSFALKLDGGADNVVDFLARLETEKLIAIENWELLPLGSGYQLSAAGTLFIRNE